MNIIETDVKSGDATYGLRITLCGNDECLCSGRDIDHVIWHEASNEAVQAADDAIYNTLGTSQGVEISRNFADWNGGRCYKKNLGYGFCCIDAWLNTDDGWERPADVPEELKKLAASIADSANNSIDAVLEKWEQLEAEVEESH